MLRLTVIGTLVLAGAIAQDAAAQRRLPGAGSAAVAPEDANLSVMARLGTKSYTSTLPGTCKHEPSASIYDIPAALYTVQANGSDDSEIKQLSLTLWQPKDGSADQVSLSLQAGSRSAQVDVSPRSPPVGTASVKLQPIASGGKLELQGKDAKGTPVYLTISCPTFAAIEAEGG
jgi:hypothetical protein